VAPSNLALGLPPHLQLQLGHLCLQLDAYIERVSQIVEREQTRLHGCQYEDELGCCGRTATVGSLEYERELCDRHFRAVTR
jgi:hypothetical protein